MKYRPDIDGLRALAVLSVVFFHASIPPFSGGFVGVDFFFVISGFLISSIILKDIEKDQFKYKIFWEKRIRRIFPAALACLFLTSISTLFILSPTDLVAFGKSLFSNGFFSSNIYFWKSSNYFNEVTEFFPLLHTWSLSIEEQFYLFLPMSLIFLRTAFKNSWNKAFGILVLISFGLCVWGTEVRPVAAFYLLPTRAWELGFGSLLAFYLRKNSPPSGKTSEALGLIGLGLLLYSVFSFDKETVFPGVNALVPVLGSVFIILSEKSFVNKILGTRVFVGIGKISYSLYLWHWVCLVTIRNIFIIPPTLTENVIAIFVSLGISVISYFYVEQPFRNNTSYWNRSKILGLFTVSSLFYLLFGIGIWMGDGFPKRFGGEFVDYKLSSPIFQHQEICQTSVGVICKTEGFQEGRKEVFVWGDSHGQAVVGSIFEATKGLGVNLSFSIKNGCPPLIEAWPLGMEHRLCLEHNQKVLKYIKEKKPLVLIVGRFDIYYQSREESEASQKKEMFLTSSEMPNKQRSKSESLKVLEENFKKITKEELSFVIFHQPPSFPKNPVELGNKSQIFGGEIKLTRNIQELLERTGPFRRLTENYNYIDSYEVLCEGSLCSAFDSDKKSLYFDDDHLSENGANKLIPLFERKLQLFLERNK